METEIALYDQDGSNGILRERERQEPGGRRGWSHVMVLALKSEVDYEPRNVGNSQKLDNTREKLKKLTSMWKSKTCRQLHGKKTTLF